MLTNFREEGYLKPEARSRGAMVNAFLTQPSDSAASTESFIESLVEGEGLKGIGGFSLACGKVGEPLAVISNRTPNVEAITWIAKKKGEIVGLSNAAIVDRSWTKVTQGEQIMADVIEASVTSHEPQQNLIERLFGVLSHDTLPRGLPGQDWESQMSGLRQSIFIPAIGGASASEDSPETFATAASEKSVGVEKPGGPNLVSDGRSGAYGTQKQTVILVTHGGKVSFVERTLYGAEGRAIDIRDRDRSFEFDIRG